VCTASWLRPADRPGGLEVFFNRDEELLREPSRPPVEAHAEGVRYLAPVDGRAGGTWLAATERGLVVALLNRSGGRREPAARASRGELPARCVAAADPDDLRARLARTDLPSYPPFTLAALWRAPAQGIVVGWDGETLSAAPLPGPVGLLCSSGLGDEQARVAREATWRRMRAAAPAGWSAERHREFHRSHDPEPHAFSVCMHREDAATVSTAEVVATAESVELVYRPGSACAPGPETRLRLEARRP
jgi:hypothetical protein